MRGAVARRESRGCHNRADIPALDPDLQVNFVSRRDENGTLELWGEPVEHVPPELEPWLVADRVEAAGRLLE